MPLAFVSSAAAGGDPRGYTRKDTISNPPPLAGLLHLRASHFWAAITWTLRDQQILAALPLTGA